MNFKSKSLINFFKSSRTEAEVQSIAFGDPQALSGLTARIDWMLFTKLTVDEYVCFSKWIKSAEQFQNKWKSNSVISQLLETP